MCSRPLIFSAVNGYGAIEMAAITWLLLLLETEERQLLSTDLFTAQFFVCVCVCDVRVSHRHAESACAGVCAFSCMRVFLPYESVC